MNINFSNMKQSDLISYVLSFDSAIDESVNQYVWSYSHISMDDFINNYETENSRNEWIEWIESEQQIFKDDLGIKNSVKKYN